MTDDAGFGAAAIDPTQATKAAEETIQRIRDLTDRLIESTKKAGNSSLDAYEKSLHSLVEFQERAAGATQLDWVSNVAAAHAKFVQDLSNAYVSAAREMLK